METMDVYQKNLNKTTYQKIKHEARSALMIYAISSILSKLVTYLIIAPILFVVSILGRIFTKLSYKTIPKTEEELSLEKYYSRKEQELFRDERRKERVYKDTYNEWKKRKLLVPPRSN